MTSASAVREDARWRSRWGAEEMDAVVLRDAERTTTFSLSEEMSAVAETAAARSNVVQKVPAALTSAVALSEAERRASR
jgi:hypothetical protein